VRYARHKLLSDALAVPLAVLRNLLRKNAGPAGGRRRSISDVAAARAAQVRNNSLTRG
jgi:hypothetical protein